MVEHKTIQSLVKIKYIYTARLLLDFWHGVLICKLLTIGIDCSTIRIIKIFLFQRHFRTHVGTKRSGEYFITAVCLAQY